MDVTPAQRTREILRKVRQVEIRSRRAVDEAFVGSYHSVFKGRGIDFSEVREYQPGDDVRTIDWNVTARLDRPFVKVFTEERELTLMLLIDVSASLDFGSQVESKRELAAEVSSVLAYSAARNRDKVGMLLFSDRVEHYVPPRQGRQHILRLIRDILFFTPRHQGTNLAEALRFLNRVQRRKSICFLISDFIEPETFQWAENAEGTNLQKLLRITNRRHDLICLHLMDPHEREIPRVGWLVVEDAETGEVFEIDTGSDRVRGAIRESGEARARAVRSRLTRAGVDVVDLSTEQPFLQSLRRLFEKREARR